MAKIVFLMIKNLVLKLWVENSCFWKTFKLILMHFIHEITWVELFLHNLLLFFENFKFLEFQPIKNSLIFNHCSQPDSIGIQSMHDWSKLKNFQFLSFWPKFFFMHRLCLGFTCIELFSVSILQFCSHISRCFHT